VKFSIIIPVYNARKTLPFSLDSLYASFERDFEVIAVDDRSTDDSVRVLKEYPCVILCNEKNRGCAASRNRGATYAHGEILVFMDADVVIRRDALPVIEKCFLQESDAIAITGMLAKECPVKGFFSQYKNLYMHYVFGKCPRVVDFLYGSLSAIKKEYFIGYNEQFRFAEDTSLGRQYRALNQKIVLSKDLQVVHLKRYNFSTISKNDFLIPYWFVRAFIVSKGYRDILRMKGFSHTRWDQIINILVSFLLIVFMLSCITNKSALPFFFLSVTFFLFLNYSFFAFLWKEKGFRFTALSVLFTLYDSILMGCGIATGFFFYPLKRCPQGNPRV
jgi:glycosyltransferase involved in cell wall biosynthesis